MARVPTLVEILPAAQEDVQQIFAYSRREHGQAAADKYLTLFHECLNRLKAYPESAPKLRSLSATMRHMPFGRHSIYYEFDGGVVRILRVLHQSMDARARLKR